MKNRQSKQDTTAPCLQEDRVTTREVVAYGLGGFAGTMPNQFRLQFSMSFLTDVAKLNIGAVGILSMLLSIWDAINDPLIGWLVDRTDCRWGKYRPHMVMGALCWAVTILLLFTVPNLSTNGRMCYYTIVLALFSVFFTQFTIPWQALNSVMSRDAHQRNLLLTARQMVGAFATSAVGLFAIPVVSHFENPRHGWLASAGIVAVFCVTCALLAAQSAKRFDYRHAIPTAQKLRLGKQLRQVLHNKAVLCASLLMGVVNLGISFNAAISLYYLKYIVEDVNLLSIISIIKICATLALVPLMPLLMRRFGKLSVLGAGMVLQALSALCLLILWADASALQVVLMSTLTGLGLTYANTCCFALIPDCTDYTQLHFGTAQAGFINAIGTFTRKFCGSFSALIIGGLLALVGYQADAVVSESVRAMILHIKVWLPPILLGLTLLLLRRYPITTAYSAQMRAELGARR